MLRERVFATPWPLAADWAADGQPAPDLALDRADVLIRAGRQAEARALLEALKAQLTDPLAERIRTKADQLLAELAAAKV